jgi:hypothetical protein
MKPSTILATLLMLAAVSAGTAISLAGIGYVATSATLSAIGVVLLSISVAGLALR